MTCVIPEIQVVDDRVRGDGCRARRGARASGDDPWRTEPRRRHGSQRRSRAGVRRQAYSVAPLALTIGALVPADPQPLQVDEIDASSASPERATSVSSIRRIKAPPRSSAKRLFAAAVNAPPRGDSRRDWARSAPDEGSAHRPDCRSLHPRPPPGSRLDRARASTSDGRQATSDEPNRGQARERERSAGLDY